MLQIIIIFILCLVTKLCTINNFFVPNLTVNIMIMFLLKHPTCRDMTDIGCHVNVIEGCKQLDKHTRLVMIVVLVVNL